MTHDNEHQSPTLGMQMLMERWDLEECAASAALKVAADLGVDVEDLVALVVDASHERSVNV